MKEHSKQMKLYVQDKKVAHCETYSEGKTLNK